MTNINNVSQYLKLEWGPVPSHVKVESHLNGKRLPISVENFRGISLCRLYSTKQIRKIHRIRKERANIGNRKSNKEVVYQ
jgi:hypothetical protein